MTKKKTKAAPAPSDVLHGLRDVPRLLRALGAIDPVNGSQPSEIADRIGVPRGFISRATPRLMERGLLRIERVEGNRRSVMLRLTDKGVRFVATIQPEPARRTSASRGTKPGASSSSAGTSG